MKVRAIKRRHDARTLRWARLYVALGVWWQDCDEWPEEDDEFSCTRCAGTGYMEADDPLLDDADEFGEIECEYCGGTGLREHQSIF